MGRRLNKRCPNCGSTVLKIEMLSNGLLCYECTKCGQTFEGKYREFEDSDDDYLFFGKIGNTKSQNREDGIQLNLHKKDFFAKIKGNLTAKTEFRHWLVEKDGKSEASANNYICGFDAAQKHYNACTQSKLNFYDIDDIKMLENIFSKYIDGEYSEIGKKYSGAVRASLKAYLRFFQQKNIGNCDSPSNTSVLKAVVHKKNGFTIEIREKHDDRGKEYTIPHINPESDTQSNPYYKKALHKIRKWAYSPEQQNHKLIKAYFKAFHRFGEPPTKSAIQQICSDINKEEFYVRDFVGTYNSLKADGITTNGKIFEDDGEHVRIWEEVEDELLKYEKFFYNLESK